MPIQIDRRALLVTAGFGIGSLLLPGGSLAAQALSAAKGFTHNVASGEPGPDSVLLWTRFVPATRGPARVSVELSDSADFRRIVAGGQMVTGPWRDYTVKITVDGLEPGRLYHYRFTGPDGSASPTGRTKTLPMGKIGKFTIAAFSCSNMGYGYFNAYAHAAARGDIDLALHLGDYFYEYQIGGYDTGKLDARTLAIDPQSEILTLTDYRLRYAAYRSDPDLQALHQNVAMIANTDDHEGANDSWEGGAQNHQPDEGDWTNRKNAAMQAWHEWLPVGEQPWKTYDIGDLATYFRTDTRMIARSRPWAWQEIQRGNDIPAALKAFRDGPWQDSAATMLGSEQESWLSHAFATHARARKGWALLGVGTNIGYNMTPPEAMDWIGADAERRTRSYMETGIAAGKAGMPYNLDNWGGYPRARARLLTSAQSAGVDLIAVTGDSHNGWAFDLAQDGKAAGVEFGGHSVTSPGMEQAFGHTDPAVVLKGLVANSKELRWADTANRGYMLLSLTPEGATNEWVAMETVASRSTATKPGHSLKVRRGRNMLEG
jgi:alkaline phosphatase D